MSKPQKITTVISLLILAFIIFFSLFFNNLPASVKNILTVPLLPTPTISSVITPISINTSTPKAADISRLAEKVSDKISLKEKAKTINILPLQIANFVVSNGLTTNINVYTLDTDPKPTIRLEIYGPNYNIGDSANNPQAIAFAESFVNVRDTLAKQGIDLRNLQIIYGGRQYIQTTAENWVTSLGLLK